MSDPNPVVVDPTIDPAPAPTLPPLIEAYPACFDWEHPRPLKLGIHKDIMAAGLAAAGVKPADLKRALARYCNRPLYRRTLRSGAVRVDLQGQPAGVVTAAEAEAARADFAAWKARKAGLPVPPRPGQAALPPNDTPIPKENLVPGRLELTAKFSELPRPFPVQGGVKIGIQTGAVVVTAILSAKVWRKLEQAAKDYPQWVASLSGAPDRFADGEITLQHPALQVFEKKAKPEVAPEATGPTAPDARASDPAAPEAKTPPAPTPALLYPKLSLKERGASGAS